MNKEDIKLEFDMLISYAKSFGEDEEECWGNLEHAYDVLYNGAKQCDDPFTPKRDDNEYIVGIIGCAADYAYDENLQMRTRSFYERAWDILVG